MSESKVLYESTSPKTQSIEAVQALLKWKGVSSDPLPSEVSLSDGRLVLVLSNKKDCYYTTTAREIAVARHATGSPESPASISGSTSPPRSLPDARTMRRT